MKHNTPESRLAYSRTKKGLVTRIYGSQLSVSKQRGHNKPTYTNKELKEWLYSQKEFHEAYDNWKRLEYAKEYRPSVDRIDDYLGYSLGNIQLMTWGENHSKYHSDVLNGINTKNCKKVLQYDIDGNLIQEFHSARDAGRAMGLASHSSIASCCRGNQKTCLGFVWKYEEYEEITK